MIALLDILVNYWWIIGALVLWQASEIKHRRQVMRDIKAKDADPNYERVPGTTRFTRVKGESK